MIREIDVQPNDHVVFIHIPKTAGTTFNAVIEPFLSGLSKYPHYLAENLLHVPLKDLRRYRFFSGHFSYEIFADFIFPEGFFDLTLLREPISRTLSGYRFMHQLLRRGGIPELPQHKEAFELVKDLTLEEFLEHDELEIVQNFINVQTVFLGRSLSNKVVISPLQLTSALMKDFQRLFRSQGRMTLYSLLSELQRQMSDADRREFTQGTQHTLTVAQNRLEKIAFLGITEKFQDSLFLLSYIFGLRPSLDTTRLNITSLENRFSDLSPKIIDNIRNKVRLDLELYTFAQKLFQEHVTEMTQTLLSRYGKKEHAALQLPLPTEVMMDLLEHHYCQRRDGRYRKKTNALRKKHQYFLSDHLEGLFGWHPAEMFHKYGTVRWSGPKLTSGFDLPCPKGVNVRISFCVLMGIKSEILDNLSLTVNNIPIILRYKKDPKGGFVFTGSIPQNAASSLFLRLEFSVPYAVAPCDITTDNKDPRPLGFLLNWVKLEAQ